MWSGWVLETGGLTGIYGLSKCTMEESILDIKLMNGPAPRESKTENYADGSGLDDRAESLIVVHPEALIESANHPPSLVPG